MFAQGLLIKCLGSVDYISQYSSSSNQCSSQCSKGTNINFETLWYNDHCSNNYKNDLNFHMTLSFSLFSEFQILINIFVFFHIDTVVLRYSDMYEIPFSWTFFLDCYIWSVVFDTSIDFYIPQYVEISLSWSWYFLWHMLLSFCDAIYPIFFCNFPVNSSFNSIMPNFVLSLYNHLLYELLIYILSGRFWILVIYPVCLCISHMLDPVGL